MANVHAAEAVPRTPSPTRRPLRTRRWRALVWLLAIALVIAFGWRFLSSRRAAAIPVHVHQVERGAVRDRVTSLSAGRVGARREATLRAEIAGTVKVLHHRRGDRVRAGEPLVSYDPAELRERLGLALAGASVARAQSAQAEASVALASSVAKRAARLVDAGALPTAEAETLDRQAEIASRASDAARAGLGQAGASVQLARTALGRSVLVAPFDGVILSTAVEEGEITAPGAPLLALADTSALHLEADVDEADLGKVAVGMPVEATFDAFPGERLRGELVEIAPGVTRDPRGSRSVVVRARLAPNPRLRVGMSADVDIIVETREGVVWVPPNAVLGRGTERSVFVVEGGVARKRAIEVGISTWEAVEVKGGLSGGESVVVTLGAKVVEGARVEAQRVDTRKGGT